MIFLIIWMLFAYSSGQFPPVPDNIHVACNPDNGCQMIIFGEMITSQWLTVSCDETRQGLKMKIPLFSGEVEEFLKRNILNRDTDRFLLDSGLFQMSNNVSERTFSLKMYYLNNQPVVKPVRACKACSQ